MTDIRTLLPRAGPQSLVEAGKTADTGSEASDVQAGGEGFVDFLTDAIRRKQEVPGLEQGEIPGRTGSVRLSGHATARLHERNIAVTPRLLDQIGQAMDRLAEKGGRESLLIGEGALFVVSVPNRTVITAVPQGGQGDDASQVFTQIDSAAILR